MEQSILKSIKKLLGLPETDSAFDADVIAHINTVFNTLNQLGIGITNGFAIEGADETWDTYLGEDKNLNMIKSYMLCRVKLLFDPPATSFGIAAIQEQIKEFEFRINVIREDREWVKPIDTSDPEYDPWADEVVTQPAPIVLDGGDANLNIP